MSDNKDQIGILLRPDEDSAYQKQKALIEDIGEFVKIKNTDTKEYLDEMIRMHPLPIKIFNDINRTYCDNGTYEKLRLNALFKLIYLLDKRQNKDYKNLNAGHTVKLVKISKLLSFVFSSYDMMSAENMLLLILNDNFVCRKVYTSDHSATDRCLISQSAVREAMNYSRGSKIIMVHSHLGGDVEPSVDDINTTAEIKALSYEYGCDLFEHFIVSMKNGEYVYNSILAPKQDYEENTFVVIQKRLNTLLGISKEHEENEEEY